MNVELRYVLVDNARFEVDDGQVPPNALRYRAAGCNLATGLWRMVAAHDSLWCTREGVLLNYFDRAAWAPALTGAPKRRCTALSLGWELPPAFANVRFGTIATHAPSGLKGTVVGEPGDEPIFWDLQSSQWACDIRTADGVLLEDDPAHLWDFEGQLQSKTAGVVPPGGGHVTWAPRGGNWGPGVEARSPFGPPVLMVDPPSSLPPVEGLGTRRLAARAAEATRPVVARRLFETDPRILELVSRRMESPERKQATLERAWELGKGNGWSLEEKVAHECEERALAMFPPLEAP